ncbi:MAG: P-loop NTPase [Candidatus Omnitrophota bacterium]|nr:P-loop NTPase [Candidatus Omnitrophota bacterium]MDZ4242627.1 P-loop NTPase [Candidatus Omnitrophota bacterium]
MLTEQNILKALSQIIDPDLHKDIVTLGFVRNIVINGADLSFDIALTTPACPVRAEFETRAREAVQGLPGIKNVKINMTTLPRSQASTALPQGHGLEQVRSLIAVSSCKGGVGKSTVTAQFASELARRGFRVGILDADIHGPSIPALFDIQNPQIEVNAQKQFLPIERNKLKIMSFGFLLGDAPAVMRGPMVSNYIQQLIHNTAWGELDYLFLDMPPGTGDVQLTITQNVRLSGAVIVTTRQTLSLIDVSRGILMFEKVDVPILGIVENMAYFICNHCTQRHEIFGNSKGRTLSDRFGLATLAEIPILPQFTHPIQKPMENMYISNAVDAMVRALGTISVRQKQSPDIRFDQSAISLRWADGTQDIFSNRDVRLSCGCALCVNEMTGEKILNPESIRADIAALKIVTLGNYAIGIDWNDGHSSGIYPYKNLKSLPQGSAASPLK